MMTIIESEVNPKLQILAEGHEALLEKRKRMEKQDELTDIVVILEEAGKRSTKKLNAIKKAQMHRRDSAVHFLWHHFYKSVLPRSAGAVKNFSKK